MSLVHPVRLGQEPAQGLAGKPLTTRGGVQMKAKSKKFTALTTLLVVAGLLAVAIVGASASASRAAPARLAGCSYRHANWASPGGNPVVRGGAYTRSKLHAALVSSQGRQAMTCAGYTRTEQNALIAATSSAKLGFIPQNSFYGMMCGGFGECFTDGRLTGGTLAAWTVTGVTAGGEKIVAQFAQLCVNVVPRSKTRIHKLHKAVRPPAPKKAPLSIIKIAEDDQGHQLAATPTGTFRFKVRCDGKVRFYVYNHSPQGAGSCTVGKRAEFWELSTLGNEQWKMLSPSYQVIVVGKKGARAVFKDQEVPPPAPAPTPPTTTTTTTTTTPTPSSPPAPKDGTGGAGSGTPGSSGGSGSGGSPGSGSGSVCRDPNTGNIVPGNADQFGYCT